MGTQMLAPQRKDLDAAYATAHGIRVPKVFNAFDAAQNFVLHEGGKLIIRTEHPLEREGLSGLNMSHTVSLEKVTKHEKEGGLFASFRGFTPELLDYMMQDWHKQYGSAKYYCADNGINLDEYVAGLGHSYWEYVHGYNLYVVADPQIANRHRVFASWTEVIEGKVSFMTSYDVFDGMAKLSSGQTHHAVLSKLEEIFWLYNKVREIFGSEMCWVVEMQLAEDGELYFLQRSVGQNFKPCEWSFDGDESCHFLLGPKYDYGEVRGVTPKEGITVSVIMERGTRMKWLKSYEPSAMLNAHTDSTVIDQKLLGSVKAYIQITGAYHGDGARDPHSVILPLVRAPLYLYLPDLHKRLPPHIHAELKRLEKAKREGSRNWYSDPDKMVQVTIHVRSDGNEARINILKIV